MKHLKILHLFFVCDEQARIFLSGIFTQLELQVRNSREY
jgi:hypothetical protein